MTEPTLYELSVPGRTGLDLPDADVPEAELPVDLLSLSGHKIYGPKGVGALYCARRVRLRAQLTGGGHERRTI